MNESVPVLDRLWKNSLKNVSGVEVINFMFPG